MNKKFAPLLGDNPIQSSTEDVLDRDKLAKHFAETVLSLERKNGVVTSIFGPWGTGKTSFANLAIKQLEYQCDVLEFNPWLFSGTKQLVRSFFAEISTQMASKKEVGSLVKIGRLFRKYGMLASDAINLISVCFFGVSLQLQTFRSRASKNQLRNSRKQLEIDLQARTNRPIVIVIDDIDRLPASEIRDIFQLVRLTASFPNFIYIVICDRTQVEKALEESGISGRVYLEKIVQFPFDMPETSKAQINEQASITIENILSASALPSLSGGFIWLDVYHYIILPLIRNMRDVRRYAIAIQQALINFDQEIERIDILALEAIRLFMPNVFKLLPEAIDILTIPPSDQYSRRQIENIQAKANEALDKQTLPNERIKQLIEAGGESQKKVVQSMLRYLFPATANHMSQPSNFGFPEQLSVDDGSKQLKNRRVAHESILRLYLEQAKDPGLLAYNDATQARQAMENEAVFENFWRQKDPHRWLSIIFNLEELEDEFLPQYVIPGVTGLLNLLPNMPTRSQHPYHINQIAISRVVLRLFRKLQNVNAADASTRKILMNVSTLSSRMALVQLVGHKKDIGNKIVSETAADEFEKFLCDQIHSAHSNEIAEERDPASLIWFAKFDCDVKGHSYMIENSIKLTYALLRSLQTRALLSSVDSKHVRLQEPKIDWDTLSRLCGGKATLVTYIQKLDAEFGTLEPWLKAQGIPISEAQQTLTLARKYTQHFLDPEN